MRGRRCTGKAESGGQSAVTALNIGEVIWRVVGDVSPTCAASASEWTRRSERTRAGATPALPGERDSERSAARARREVYLATFSLSSHSGLQPDIVVLCVSFWQP